MRGIRCRDRKVTEPSDTADEKSKGSRFFRHCRSEVNTLITVASEFSTTENICEGDDCEAITDVTYRVEVNKKLCLNCASKEPRILKSKEEGCIRTARKVGRNPYCGKDGNDIDSYGKTHDVACCYSYGMIGHTCHERLDIGDFKEIEAMFRGLAERVISMLESCLRMLNHDEEKLHKCRIDFEKHQQASIDENDKEMKTHKDSEQEDAAKINPRIHKMNEKLEEEEITKLNKKIRKNNEEREKRLQLNHTSAENRRQHMDKKQRFLHADIQNIAEETRRKIDDLEKSCQDDTKTTENTIHTLHTVLEDDQNVIIDGHRVITSVADKLDKPLDEGGVKHITRTVSGVRFSKGAGREKYNGRIDGYDGEWKLIDTINIKDKIKFPTIVGCIDECNLIITDRSLYGNLHTYMSDTNTKHTQRVITGSDTSWVASRASLSDDKVVCGKALKGCTEDGLTECISVYDRRWKLINDVTIPRNTTGGVTWVDVAADQDGIIIAAERRQSKIYVINPADGKIMNIITSKEDIGVRVVLSSTHIIAQPYPVDHRVFIMEREDAHGGIQAIRNVFIDLMTDMLHGVTSDDECKTCMIDQNSGADMKKRRVA